MDEKEKHIEELREFYKNKNVKGQKPEKEVKKKKNKIFTLFKYLGVTLAFAAFIFFAIFISDKYYIPDLVHTRSKVRIPEVEGMNSDEATKLLEKRGLRAEILKERYDPRVPKNSVLRQSPEAGKIVKEKRSVYITVSMGAEKIKVPKLVGISFREARIKLLNSGLTIGEVDYKNSEVYPADTVLSQSIENGKEVVFGDRVDLVISQGSENQIVVPDLLYKSFVEAEEMIENAGLRLGTVTTIQHGLYIDGTVVGQFPLPGDDIIKNSYIDIEIVNND